MSTTQGSRSFKARPKIELSQFVGCFYCCKTYAPSEIIEWVDSQKTAICPKCGIDSVVPFDEELDGDMEKFGKQLKIWNKSSF